MIIVDFKESTIQTKALLDLEVAAQVTKAVEPFFLDEKNGNLYSWTGTKSGSISTAEESKSNEQASLMDARTMLSLMSVPTHG